MTVSIRPWRADDTSGVVHVIRSVYDEYRFTWDEAAYHADLYDIQKYYLDAGHAFFVAEAGGNVVGTVALERFPRHAGQIGETIRLEDQLRAGGVDCSLERLYVLESERGAGVGTALVNHVLQAAMNDGRRAMELWSDKRFEEAHRLYMRFGATIIGERICHDPDQSPEWGLVIDLEKATLENAKKIG